MNVLAFDLANFSSSLALMKQGEIVAFEHQEEFRNQDVTLLPKLKAFLVDNKMGFQDLDRIITTAGPGSFTGIRVALATAQGLSFAAQVPALAVPAFEWVVKSYHAPPGFQKILVLLESLRLELYGQLFHRDGTPEGSIFSLAPKDIQNNKDLDGVLCIGNGAHHMKDYGFSVENFMPQARHLAEFAKALSQDEFSKYPCVPVYSRAADTTRPKRS